MTPQENQALQEFLNQLVQVSGIVKDPQAEALIARAVAQQPDAAYLLVQRAMLLEQGLNQAKAQITQLQNELQNAREPVKTGFLDSATGWGHSAGRAVPPAANPPLANSAPGPVYPAPGPAYPAANPAYSAAGAPYAAARPGFFGGNTGSFLTSMAATAAGVAGGAFLFHGIESLLSHPSPAAGLPGTGLASDLTSGLTDAPVGNASADQFDGGELSALDADSDGFGNLDAGADGAADDGSSLI